MITHTDPPVIPLIHCATCGAICQDGQKVCWLCQADPSVENPYGVNASPEQQPTEPTASTPLDALFWVLLAICFLLALLVGLGLAAEEPGTLVPYALVVGPAFLIPGVRALWQIGRGERPRPTKLMLSVALTFAITIAVVVLLALAAVGLLLLICLSAIAGGM